MKIKIALLCWSGFAGALMAEEADAGLELHLNQFHLPPAVLESSDLESVADALEKSYRKYSSLDSGQERPLEIHVPKGGSIFLTGKIPSQSIGATLSQISGQAGLTVSFGDKEVFLRPLVRNPKRGVFQLQVPHDFLNDLALRTSVSVISQGGPHEVFLKMQSEDLKRAFGSLGILTDDESTLSLNQERNSLTLKSTHHEHERVQLFLKSMKQSPRQIRVTTKLVKGPGGMSFPTGGFDPLEIQKMMRKVSQVEGVEILIFPSLVMLPGGSGTVAMIKNEIPFDDSWTGRKLRFELNLRGEGIAGRFDFHLREPNAGGDGGVTDYSPSGTLTLVDGGTLVRKIKNRDGASRFVLITTEIIDATGRRTN